VEILNPLNRVIFGAPVLDIRSTNFGVINNTAAAPRAVQFGMKLSW